MKLLATPHSPIAAQHTRLLALALVAGFLAGCGGGSDASDAEPGEAIAALPEASSAVASEAVTSETSETNEARESPAAVVAPPPLANYNCGLANYQTAMLARINQYRAAGANCRTRGTFAKTTPLAWNTALLVAASGHSKDMATKNYFSHTSLDGRTFDKRITAAGYTPWSTIGENIAAGYASINAVVDGWMTSDGHCANIMSPAFKDVGVACYAAAGSAYGKYWTMDLGRLR